MKYFTGVGSREKPTESYRFEIIDFGKL